MALSTATLFLYFMICSFSTSNSVPVFRIAPISLVELTLTERWKPNWVNGAPCRYDDENCTNKLALKYVNALRTEYNLPPFKLGTQAMLNNAVKHSEYMSKSHDRTGHMWHEIARRKRRSKPYQYFSERSAQ